MQAQLVIRRSPSTIILLLFAMAATLLVGGSLGYVLKPATVLNVPARVVVVHDESGLYSVGGSAAVPEPCVWIGNPAHKVC